LDTSENAEPLETHFYPCRDFHPEAITLRKKDAIVTAIVIPKFVNGVTNQIEFVDEVKPLQLTIGQLIYQQTRNSVVAHFSDVMNSYNVCQRCDVFLQFYSYLFYSYLCCPVSVLAKRLALRSAARGEFLVPRARLAIMQRRAFSVVGPSAWNDLPFELRSLLMAHPSKFYISLKSFLFVRDWAGSASE